MMNTDENTPIKGTGKNGKGGPPAKKAAKRNRKPEQQAAPEPVQAAPQLEQVAPEPAQIEQPQESITVAPAMMEDPAADAAPEASAPDVAVCAPDVSVPTAVNVSAPTAPDVFTPTATAEPTESAPVSLQTITNAYGDFTRKSIEQTSSFLEQLAGVRSLSKALELQVEFAKQTIETFISESRKIRDLHSELTMQRFRNLEGFVARMKPTRS